MHLKVMYSLYKGMNLMSFKTVTRLLKINFAVTPVLASLLLMYISFGVLDLDPIAFILIFFIVFLLIILLMNIENKVVDKMTLKTVFAFFDTLNTKELYHLYNYYMKKVKRAPNPIVKAKHIYKAYMIHKYINSDKFEYINQILDVEAAYDDMFYFKAIVIRENILFSLIENAQIEDALVLIKKQLMYMERMIDDDQVPQELQEKILSLCSLYRHTIRFIESPNERTAYSIFKNEKGTNFDKVKTYYIIARVFIENDMEDKAKTAIEQVKDMSGDYRLLERLKEYYNEL